MQLKHLFTSSRQKAPTEPEVKVILKDSHRFPGDVLHGLVQLEIYRPLDLLTLELKLVAEERSNVGRMLSFYEVRKNIYYLQYATLLGMNHDELLGAGAVETDDDDGSLRGTATASRRLRLSRSSGQFAPPAPGANPQDGEDAVQQTASPKERSLHPPSQLLPGATRTLSLSQGTYIFPFEIPLPDVVPPSFELRKSKDVGCTLTYTVECRLISRSGHRNTGAANFVMLAIPVQVQRWLFLQRCVRGLLDPHSRVGGPIVLPDSVEANDFLIVQNPEDAAMAVGSDHDDDDDDGHTTNGGETASVAPSEVASIQSSMALQLQKKPPKDGPGGSYYNRLLQRTHRKGSAARDGAADLSRRLRHNLAFPEQVLQLEEQELDRRRLAGSGRPEEASVPSERGSSTRRPETLTLDAVAKLGDLPALPPPPATAATAEVKQQPVEGDTSAADKKTRKKKEKDAEISEEEEEEKTSESGSEDDEESESDDESAKRTKQKQKHTSRTKEDDEAAAKSSAEAKEANKEEEKKAPPPLMKPRQTHSEKTRARGKLLPSEKWEERFVLPIRGGMVGSKSNIELQLSMPTIILTSGGALPLRVSAIVDNTKGNSPIRKLRFRLVTRVVLRGNVDVVRYNMTMAELAVLPSIDKGKVQGIDEQSIPVPESTPLTLATDATTVCTFLQVRLYSHSPLRVFSKSVECEVLIVGGADRVNTSRRLLRWTNYFRGRQLNKAPALLRKSVSGERSEEERGGSRDGRNDKSKELASVLRRRMSTTGSASTSANRSVVDHKNCSTTGPSFDFHEANKEFATMAEEDYDGDANLIVTHPFNTGGLLRGSDTTVAAAERAAGDAVPLSSTEVVEHNNMNFSSVQTNAKYIPSSNMRVEYRRLQALVGVERPTYVPRMEEPGASSSLPAHHVDPTAL